MPTDWLLDLIYDAAAEPELWRSVLTEIADRTNSQGGIIFGLSIAAKHIYFDYNGRLDEDCKRAHQERHIQNPWSLAMLSRPTGQIVMSDEIVPLPLLQKTSFFDEVLYPQDVAHSAMIPLATKADFHAAFNICRSERQGAFGDEERRFLEELVPHLHRSLTLSFRLDAYRAMQTMEDSVLDKLTAGIILLDRRARVIYTNASARAHGREGGALRFRNATVFAHSTRHSRQLGELVQNALSGAVAMSMSIPRPDGHLLTILVTSIRGRDVGRFSDHGLRDAAVLIYVVDPANRNGIPIEWLMDAYGLTQAEARVAVAAASGFNIPELANQMTLSPNTVKTHLRRAFAKTGTGRQAELARLVAVIGAIRNDRKEPSEDD